MIKRKLKAILLAAALSVSTVWKTAEPISLSGVR